MTPPLVSTVIAAYNASLYIEATCRSAMAQTYPNLEIVVVDDGSTDDTAEIVARLAASDPRIRLIRQANAGVAAARNRAIAACAGEFIAPLDADDLWDPEKVERQMAALAQGGPDAVMAYCWWAWIDSDGRVLDHSPRWHEAGRVLDRLVEVNFTGSASVPMFRRAALDAVGGYDPSLRARGCQGCEDWDVALRMAERGTVVVAPHTLVAYRRHRNSMSAACDTMWRSRAAVIGALVQRTPTIDPQVVRRSAGQFALYLAGVSYWSGQPWAAFRWTMRAGAPRLIAAIMPHVARLLLRRARQPESPLVVGASPHLQHLGSPQPLIPYDRIYARIWAGRPRR